MCTIATSFIVPAAFWDTPDVNRAAKVNSSVFKLYDKVSKIAALLD